MTARVIAHPKLGARLVETVIRRAESQWSGPSEHPEYRALMSLGEKAAPKPRSQAVKPVTPREAVDALCDRLASQRDALDAQIAGLRLATTASDQNVSGDLVLALYLSLGSAGATVEFADRQGWRLPSKKGPELPRRRYCTADVYALVKGKPCAIPPPSSPALARMALAQLARGQGR